MARTVRLESLDDPRLDAYARLTEHQLRSRLEPERAMLVAESRNVIDVALAQGLEPLSFLVDESHLASAADLFARAPEEVPVFVLPQEQLERLCGFKVTRGLLACFRRPAERGVAEIPRRRTQRGGVGGPGGRHQRGGALPVRGGAGGRRRASLAALRGPALPPFGARLHGHGLPGAVDARGGRRVARGLC